ncbi:MAG TPA: NIPSNAP family protein [Dehalococcoidia bacterium]|jgi:hypothetical protein|nr:hypothetical protein [Chloroflexota bacterium]MDP5877023.1 NIPSNAP family protein [Dehalococcoidia bacterium]MDP7212906.1 NIPSNAP family protein [Dehalococcoidia bacterium]MDP7514704.1 NIPSNAP family protein [Dehalococcoidia bacterium]HCV26936.1 hypothetical protein [Dehalococcoidia bacterium]|tara:strand:- start:336 stop:953 length:618 start_codon:yes stop_codon:yes gene_type:complete
MIHEIRTYDLVPRGVPEFLEKTGALAPERVKVTPLGGFFYTEVGALNQVVHIWPYDDMNHRTDTRAQVVADGVWPPDNASLILNMQSEIYYPAPFMEPLTPRKIGPLFELRIYKYPQGGIPKVIDAWSAAIEERVKFSPLVGAWYSDIGGLNRWAHMWAYESFEHRMDVRNETRAKGVWPPPNSSVSPLAQENKLMWAAEFSPIQ